MQFDYDLIVLGSGPAGQRAAVQAAKIGKKACLIERKSVIGGVCVNTGTIPSKTLREAVMHLSGYRERNIYGASYTVKQGITVEDLVFRTEQVIKNEIDVTRHQMIRNGIEIFAGLGSFVDPHTIRLTRLDGKGHRELSAANIVIATGTHSTKEGHIPFDGQRVMISDDVISLDALPKSLAVVGAGVIGCEYATIFSALGIRVTLIDKRNRLLPFLDHEIADALAYQMQQQRVTLRLGEEVNGIEPFDDEKGSHVRISLASGKQVITDRALYSIGRTGATDELNLEAAGLTADDRGRLAVNEKFQTSVSHIYAAGDVIGFPSLASTSMEQGRLAACNAFGHPAQSVAELFPYGIYTIPEISTVGMTEEELTRAGIPYEIGKARYKEIARGQILGDTTGFLKLIFNAETRVLLGVHILGEGASELIHIGQAVLAFRGKVDYFVDAVFNYPTLAECYKTAAFDGINRLG